MINICIGFLTLVISLGIWSVSKDMQELTKSIEKLTEKIKGGE